VISIAVIVGARSSVFVLEAIDVLMYVWTVIDVVWDSVAVTIALATLGTSIVIAIAVVIFLHGRSCVVDIENPVALVVEIRTAVAVLEPIFVFGIVRTGIFVVGNAIAVSIFDSRLISDSE